MRKISEATPNLLLVKARLEKKWTQEEAASQIGIDPNTYSRWERGIIIPTPRNQHEISKIYRKKPEDLGFFKHVIVRNAKYIDGNIANIHKHYTSYTEFIGREEDINKINDML